MTAIDVEVQVATAPQVDVDVQLEPPTFSIISVLPTGPRGPAGPAGADGVGGPHAASHADGGADEVALAGEQITTGTVADARIASTLARDSEVTAAVAAEATLARNADNLTSGTVADARVASTIARDSEVTSAVAAEAVLARNADNLTSGTVADARIASTIARDSEVAAGYQPLDSDLTAIAAIATAPFGRALLALLDAAALRGALALGFKTVQDFGAVGDSTWINQVFTPGVSDQTALQNALSSGMPVIMQPPTYNPDGRCYRSTANLIVDDGGGFISFTRASRFTTSSSATPPPVAMIVYDGADVATAAVLRASTEEVGVQPASDTFASRVNGMVLEGIVLNGNAGKARYGLYGVGLQNPQADGVQVMGCSIAGISLNGCFQGRFSSTRVRFCSGRGIDDGGATERYGWNPVGAFTQDNAVRWYDTHTENCGGETSPVSTTVGATSNGVANTNTDLYVASLTGIANAPGWVFVFHAGALDAIIRFQGTSTSGGNHLINCVKESGDAFNYTTGDSVVLCDDLTFLADNCGVYMRSTFGTEWHGLTSQSNFGPGIVDASRRFANGVTSGYTENNCELDLGSGTAIEQGFASQSWGAINIGDALAEGNQLTSLFVQEDSIWIAGAEPAGNGYELDTVIGSMTAGKNNIRADHSNWRMVNCSPGFMDRLIPAVDGVTYPPDGALLVDGGIESATLTGGTANTDDLTLRATAHATPLQGAYITCVQGLTVRPTAETIAYAPLLSESIYLQIAPTTTLNAGAAANRLGSAVAITPVTIWNQGGIAGSTVGNGISTVATHKTAADTAITVVNLFAANNNLTITGNGDVFTATLGIAFNNTGNVTVEGDAGAGVALTTFEGYRGNYGTIGLGCTVTTLKHISLLNPTAPTGTLTTLVALDIANQTRAATNIGIRNAATTVFTSTSYAVGAGGGSVPVTSTYVKLTGVNAGTQILGNPAIVTTGAQNGQIVTIHNTDTADSVTFVHGNSVTLPGSVNLTLAPGETADFVFDGTNWVCFGAPRRARTDWFGDGSDGALAFDGTSAVTGCSLAATVYTLTRDLYASSITLSGTVTRIKTANFRIFINGTLAANVDCIISADGTAASGGTGGTGLASQTLQGSQAGGDAVPLGTGTAGQGSARALGGSGGDGGALTGSPSVGGGASGGIATAPTAAQGGMPHHALFALLGGFVNAQGTSFGIYGGGGGGAAGNMSGSGSGSAGAGGASGGIVDVFALNITVAASKTLTLRANGGAGSNATSGTAAQLGGGGGGGGGAVLLTYGTKTITGTLTLTAAGGAAGTKLGTTARDGAPGSAGTTTQIQV